MPIDDSLFAHIQNDAFLVGTVGLQGQFFKNTVLYLKKFIQHLKQTEPTTIPASYNQLLDNMDYLVQIEDKLKLPTLNLDVLAEAIVTDLKKLPPKGTLLLPGGHKAHQMINQIAYHDGEYWLTVINSGEGINYHEKKSTSEKEIYNPTKTWRIPGPITADNQKELTLFIKRLLMATLPTTNSTVETIYQEILPTIAYIDGVETESKIPEFAYTGGQLSGTCTQRCLHQMLKINSPSLAAYHTFIFAFKMYALHDYTTAFLNYTQSLTPAIATQIHLAIENNLKILNANAYFPPQQTADYYQQLITLKTTINKIRLFPTSQAHLPNIRPTFAIKPTTTTTSKDVTPYQLPVLDKPLFIHLDAATLLPQLITYLQQVEQVSSPLHQYIYLEKLLLSLPLDLTHPLYQELSKKNNTHQFYDQINKIRKLLLALNNNWLKKKPSAKLNVLLLSALSLQTDCKNLLNQQHGLPSFKNFTNQTMEATIGGQRNNPFWATHDPQLDARLLLLQDKYKDAPQQQEDEFYSYLLKLMQTEPILFQQLEALYSNEFGNNQEPVHQVIKSKNLGALYLIAKDFDGSRPLDPQYLPLSQKISTYLRYESNLREVINSFYNISYPEEPFLRLNIEHGRFRVSTPLYSTFLAYEDLSQKLKDTSYNRLQESGAKAALNADSPINTVYQKSRMRPTANSIQINGAHNASMTSTSITENEINDRDYRHLRSVPAMQVPITIDYFTRHIDKLSNESDQYYLVANLMQTGLITQSAATPSFFPQLDNFFSIALRFFTYHGEHTPSSLFLLRLEYLIDSYLVKTVEHTETAQKRLKCLQEKISKQLQTAKHPLVLYELHRYLFLTTVALMEVERDPLTPLALKHPNTSTPHDLQLGLSSFLYLQGHSHPGAEDSASECMALELAIAHFQIHMQRQPETELQAAIHHALQANQLADRTTQLNGNFPLYDLVSSNQTQTCRLNALLGRLFVDDMAKSALPLAIKNHPLLKQLGIEHIDQCLISSNGRYVTPLNTKQRMRFFINQDQLVIHCEWSIDGQAGWYELQGLSPEHLATKSCPQKKIFHDLPDILTDTSFNYWQHVDNSEIGLLTVNNTPRYAIDTQSIKLLNHLNTTETKLKPIKEPWARLLSRIESPLFQIQQQTLSQPEYLLPRYHLHFACINSQLINLETQEQILDTPSPIHSTVAGLNLEKDGQHRCLIPIQRFYASTSNTERSDVFPVIHDTQNQIAQAWAQTNQVQADSMLWHYQGSENYHSFRLKEGRPIADNGAAALYLAYIYLATNQTEKAWQTLEDCQARFGGLTGTEEELTYLMWICHDAPHILAGHNEPAQRITPPYTACQLKALSLLCDYLSQNKSIKLKKIDQANTNLSTKYLAEQSKAKLAFLEQLPQTIYNYFTKLQSSRRHLESSYALSSLERKRLLNFYHQNQQKKEYPKGSLGYEWMQLNLEELQDEQQALLAAATTNSLSKEAQRRLNQIEKHLQELQPIYACSTPLRLVALNIDLPPTMTFWNSRFSPNANIKFDNWFNCLPLATYDYELKFALEALSSDMSESDFITHFPAYFNIMLHTKDKKQVKKLFDFVYQTLIAHRHAPINSPRSTQWLLCNILYRLHWSRAEIAATLSPEQTHSFSAYYYQLKQHTVPQIEIYEAKERYESILAKPEDIIKKYPKTNIIPLKNHPTHSVPITMGIVITDFIKRYTQRNKTYEEELKQLQTPPITLNIEEAIGKKQWLLEHEQKLLAGELLQDHTKAIQLFLYSIKRQDALIQTKAHLAWRNALKLANQGPANPQKASQWQIDKAAKARPTITKAQLHRLYIRANLNDNIEQTGLIATEAENLHHIIHQALVLDIQHQQLDKIQHCLTNGLRKNDPTIIATALDLLAKEEIPGLDNPILVMLQHEENIILRSRQVEALKALLEKPDDKPFKEIVEKIIPGGGKSKVILPILAEQKAMGDNLVVIEVPQSLLATNYVDLNKVSQRLYGKKAYLFEFNRDSNASAQHLEQLYYHFLEVIRTKSYLVTTGESSQSLELKYIELLLTDEKEQDTEWEHQVHWCKQLLTLFHEHGDAIIDEVHQGLWFKKKLNYTSGLSQPIANIIIQNTIALFQLLSPEFIKKAPYLDKQYDWKKFKIDLANNLLNNPDSPLYSFTAKVDQSTKTELFNYLTEQTDQIPACLLEANAEMKSSFAFFKEQVNGLLIQTLIRKVDTKYGPSKRPGLSAIEQTLAIPYAANNTPNERSRFGNSLEAANNTCQMLLIKGISKELLIEQIALWQALSRQELFQRNDYNTLDDTPTAKGFALQWGNSLKKKVKLHDIQLDNQEQINELHEQLQFNQEIIFDILQNQSLRLISTESSVIHSDAYNHIGLYRTVQGVSGTPNNYPTFHQRLDYDNLSSIGSDGYIIECVAQKKTSISSVDYQDSKQFIKHLLTHSVMPQHCRAIIDINATFQGVSNLQVARELTDYIRSHQAQFSLKLKHVLYFDHNHVLCALDVNKPDSPILLKTTETEEINRLLNSTPDQRFTYYDQAHTLGTDITQDEEAHALVLLDEESPLQGIGRMRQFHQKQTIELITPARLQGISWPELVQRFTGIEAHALLLDNLSATQDKMRNVLRRKCLDYLKAIDTKSAKEQALLAKQLQAFFVQKTSSNLFELYGAISKSQKTADILTAHKNKLLAQFATLISKAGATISQQETAALQEELDYIIKKALPHCAESYLSAHRECGIEVEIQKEIEKQIEKETTTLTECYDPNLQESETLDWTTIDLTNLYSSAELATVSMPLNDFFASDTVNHSLFNPQLRVSHNFAKTHTKQLKYNDAFLKPVFVTWYHLERTSPHLNTNQLHATILTLQEAEQLKKFIDTTPGNWLTTTTNTVLHGSNSEQLLTHKDYKTFQEQIMFFNGELNTLANPEADFEWINENTAEKITFFAEHLRYRPGSALALRRLKKLLVDSNNEGIDYISEHAYENLEHFDWLLQFPNSSDSQIKEYKKVAAAFAYMQANWDKKELTLRSLQQQFKFSMRSMSTINNQLQRLKQLQTIIPQLVNNFWKEKYYTQTLSYSDQATLSEFLGRPLKSFYPSTTEATVNATCANLDVLMQLNAHATCHHLDDLQQLFRSIAHQTNAINILHRLLENPYIQRDCLLTILCKKEKHESLLEPILGCDDTILTELILHTLSYTLVHNDEHLRLILAKKNGKSERILQLCTQKPYTSELTFLTMLPYIGTAQTLHDLYCHPNATRELRKKIIKHPVFNKDNILLLLKSDLLFECDLLYLLQHSPSNISSQVGEAILSKPYYSEMALYELTQHFISEPIMMTKVMAHPHCSPQVVQTILYAHQANMPDNILTKLVTLTYNQILTLTAVPSSAEQSRWETLLISSIKLFNGSVKRLAPHLLDKRLSSQPKLAIQLLNLIGPSVLQFITNQQLIDNVSNEEELQIVLGEQNTNDMSATQLESVSQYCTQTTSIDLFLRRSKHYPNLYSRLLEKPNCDSLHLIAMLDSPSIDTALVKAIYLHPRASKAVKEKILAQAYCTTTILLELISQSALEKKEIITLLNSNSPAMTEDCILELASTNDQDILHAVLQQKNINNKVVRAIIAKQPTTPELYQHIMHAVSERIIDKELLLILIRAAFKQYSSDPEQKRIWHPLLFQLFIQHTKPAKPTSKVAVEDLLYACKYETPPSFAIALLNEIGIVSCHYFPLGKLIQHATPQEMSILLKQWKVGEKEELVNALAEKCDSEELITQCLHRTDLNQDCYSILLKQPALVRDHLTYMLEKAYLTPRIIEQIAHHPLIDRGLRLMLYTHYAFTSQVLRQLLSQHDKPIPPDEIHTLLACVRSTIISDQILLDLALAFITDERLLVKIVSHNNASIQTLMQAFKSPYYTPQTAEMILSQKENPLRLHLLITMIQIAFQDDKFKSVLEKILHRVKALGQENAVCAALPEMKTVSEEIGFIILSILGKSAIKVLPITNMIECMKDRYLSIMLRPAILNQLSNADCMLLLRNKCHTQDAISLFLRKSTLIKLEVLTILNKPQLTDDHLLSILTFVPLSHDLFAQIEQRACDKQKINTQMRRHPSFVEKIDDSLFYSPTCV